MAPMLNSMAPSLRSEAACSRHSSSRESHYRRLPRFSASTSAAAALGVGTLAISRHRQRHDRSVKTALGAFRWEPKVPGSVRLDQAQGGRSSVAESFVESLRTVTAPQQGRIEAAVVDCGSGSTRLIRFAACSRSSVSRVKEAYRGAPLAKALQDMASLRTLLHDLEQEVPTGQLLLGATAGVRHALKDGRISPKHVENFAKMLNERFAGRARFELLTGHAEAQAEWQAVRHEWGALQRELHSNESRTQLSGMLSGGGMSCQLVVEMGGVQPGLHSVENLVLGPQGLVEQAGAGNLQSTTLEEDLEEHCRAFRERMLLTQIPRGLSGTFALVEWVGRFIAAAATNRDLFMCLGYGRTFTRSELLRELDMHLDTIRRRNSYGSGKVTRRDTVALVYGTVIQALLQEVFAEDSKFVCVDNVNWATGHFLQNLEHLKGAKRKEAKESLKRAEETKWDRHFAVPIRDAAYQLQLIGSFV